MSFRIKHNISSINTQRQLKSAAFDSARTLEKLSSGEKINRAADGPASLVISEQMRAQIAGLTQAIDNSESGISMVQTAEGALQEVNKLFVDVRQLAIHASNAGVNDEKMLEADQAEIDNALATIDRIAQNTQFGTKQLLNGSRGANGVANGEGLQFVSAGANTSTSPIEGYDVNIMQAATKSQVTGSVALTQAIIDDGETLTVSEGGKTVSFTTLQGENLDSNINELKSKIEAAGLKIDVAKNDNGTIQLTHQEYGSEHSFSVASETSGVLSKVGNVTEEATRGADVKGTINEEDAVGRGQVLTGKDNAPNIAGLSIRYNGAEVPAGQVQNAGTVSVFQNSLQFQIGANEGQTISVSLRNMAPAALGRGQENISSIRSLGEVDVTSFRAAQDSLNIIDQAIEETTIERGKLGAFQKNTLQSNLNNLRVANENLVSAESVIRDTDMASEMAAFTKNQIMMQSATAMLAQANTKDQMVLSLLG